jgi:hyperosmotically inducible periplasmic protein
MRTLLALVLVAVLVVVFAGYWPADWSWRRDNRPPATSGTTGTVATERAKEIGAELGERAALATKKVQETVEEARLTTKIKAKMALDDTIRARAIDVSTSGTTVTVSGTVPSAAAHDRALSLARETAGVTNVIDHLDVSPAK